LEIRVLLCYYWKQNLKATEAVKKIYEVEDEDVISNRTAQNWFKRFNDGDTSLEDEPRSGRPVIVDSEALREAVGANSATSTRRLSVELDIPWKSVVRHLHQLGKVKKHCREAPHELTPTQVQRRVDTCQLLQNLHDERFIRRIVTCDEK
jgi:histone-lysine N-methyltransferase SETMAR